MFKDYAKKINADKTITDYVDVEEKIYLEILKNKIPCVRKGKEILIKAIDEVKVQKMLDEMI